MWGFRAAIALFMCVLSTASAGSAFTVTPVLDKVKDRKKLLSLPGGELMKLVQARKKTNTGTNASSADDALDTLALRIVALEDELDTFKTNMVSDVRQSLQGFVEAHRSQDETIRQHMPTGITQVRIFRGGSRPYHSGSTCAPNFLAAHNHADYDTTVGLGEFSAVINGVAFRTRHNDYKLKQKTVSTNTNYRATEDIEKPDVPPSVTGTLDQQIAEMRMYFKAFKEQDTSIRDYRPYFKPTLCYLETMWEKLESDELVEPFSSDRHAIAATSWSDLMEIMLLRDISGGKDPLENIPWLPTRAIGMDISSDGRLVARLAKFNYRVLCHPIDGDVETVRLRTVMDKSVQLQRADQSFKNESDFFWSKAARFAVDPRLGLNAVKSNPGAVVNEKRSYLDLLMEQIPGMDNYGANLTDEVSESRTTRLEGYLPGDPKRETHGTAINWQHEHGTLNTAYYSRYYLSSGDAMGRSERKRSFNDDNFWAAMTTSPEVMPFEMMVGDAEVGEVCLDEGGNPCPRVSQKWSYALPLEIIYLTPLFKWNPYNLESLGEGEVDGRGTHDDPFTAVYEKGKFYRTPTQFYGICEGGSLDEADTADTSAESKYVMAPSGKVQHVAASGQPIITPCIPGVGSVRLRYIIAPLAAEGSVLWKEMQAYEDLLKQSKNLTAPTATDVQLVTSMGFDGHRHELTLTAAKLDMLKAGTEHVWVQTTRVAEHVHDILVTAVPDDSDLSVHGLRFSIGACRGADGVSLDGACADGHDSLRPV